MVLHHYFRLEATTIEAPKTMTEASLFPTLLAFCPRYTRPLESRQNDKLAHLECHAQSGSRLAVPSSCCFTLVDQHWSWLMQASHTSLSTTWAGTSSFKRPNSYSLNHTICRLVEDTTST
ncbi:predicted protein [Plenodomus lingam JN3]|uniref:Predicted protein n=1 Tax=Leptosphaeria maculans (strain JN3 / isolate v23.1.3 / race Av1-4-5-6-7-8) TaxID=985895 RepID=E5ADU3_LEPMJ|nr:predicted protein [Plenodomus lingam JN3]CBY01382.1 predicted protein [Plenodomus lingam JN3]